MSAAEATPCVLLVEANEELAHDVSNDLRESGYIPLVATTIDSGLKEVYNHHPALIVVNRLLAGESGLDLCQQLRSQGDRTPMLLLMARDNLDDRVACIESGADDYFLKPYRSDEFLALVSAYLQPSEHGVEQRVFGELTRNGTNRQGLRGSRGIDLTM